MPHSAQAGEPPSILLIDSQRRSRDANLALLTRAHFRPTVAESVERALALVPSVKPAVIIADMSSALDESWSFMMRVKQSHDPAGSIPVVALGANPNDAARSRALMAGAAAFFPKPIDEEALIRTVRALAYTQTALDRRHADRRVAGVHAG
jgi:CheY-like chemotaxis protein